MKDLQSPDSAIISKALAPLTRHLTFIFGIILVGFLAGSAYTVFSILQRPSDEQYRESQQSSLTKTKFDQATVERIKNLRISSQDSDGLGYSVNPERRNPFTERRY